MGDRGVLHEVGPPEDDRPPQVLPERVAGAVLLEVLLEHLGRQAAHLAIGVRRRPGLRQGVLVGVGGVDLDPLAELLRSQGLGEADRHGVRLLARGAPRAPRADGPGGPTGEDLRQQVRPQPVPRVEVAEERRDVDEDRVEQRRELVGVDLEPVAVLLVPGDAHVVHAPVHPPQQARPLVPREVETPGLLEVLEQALELLRRPVGRPRRGAAVARPVHRLVHALSRPSRPVPVPSPPVPAVSPTSAAGGWCGPRHRSRRRGR